VPTACFGLARVLGCPSILKIAESPYLVVRDKATGNSSA
jgi:hypothetical protein